jgi:F0F1-type ATP synthase membrane subunit b/b'
MIQDRIEKIEATLRGAKNLPKDTRDELMALLEELKAEAAPLAKSHKDEIQSIASFADASVHEATRSAQKPALIEAALKGLSHSVKDFEVSHPRLVAVVDRLALTLSNMGI